MGLTAVVVLVGAAGLTCTLFLLLVPVGVLMVYDLGLSLPVMLP